MLGRGGARARAAVERDSRGARAGGLPRQHRGRARLRGGQRRWRARRRCRRPSRPLLQRGPCGHAPSETKRCCAVCRGAGASVRWVTSAALGGPGRQRAPGLVQSEVLLVARGGLISLRLAQGGLRTGFWWHWRVTSANNPLTRSVCARDIMPARRGHQDQACDREQSASGCLHKAGSAPCAAPLPAGVVRAWCAQPDCRSRTSTAGAPGALLCTHWSSHERLDLRLASLCCRWREAVAGPY